MVPSNATLLLAGFAADFINQGKSYTGINIKMLPFTKSIKVVNV